MTTLKIKTTDLTTALAEVRAAQLTFTEREAFWYVGPIPDAIKEANASIDGKVFFRAKRIMTVARENLWPVHRPWLIQMLLWQKVKGGSAKTVVMALKYTLLEESMRRGVPWTVAMDAHTEALAFHAYQEHKEKTRS